MKKVTENVFVETGIFACNLGLVTTKEGNIMIDTPHQATDAVRWRDEVLAARPDTLIRAKFRYQVWAYAVARRCALTVSH